MTYQPHQAEDLALKTPAFTEEELLAGDRERAARRCADPYNQAAADRAMHDELQRNPIP